MTTEEIKQLIAGLLKHMQVSMESIEVESSDGRERFSIKTPDSHMLIGTKGAHLLALNHLVKRMVSAKGIAKRVPKGDSVETAPPDRVSGRRLSGESERERTFFIDVNGYQEAAALNIKNMAKIMGERARSLKTNVELEPMSSYERMVVHSFFQEFPDLKTESVGEGERRRVVIKYVEQRTE